MSFTTPRKPADSKSKTKDEPPPAPKKAVEDKLKRTLSNLSTPRRYVQKSSTTDIYGQKKTTSSQAVKAPKKIIGPSSKSSDATPSKTLKSSTSTTTIPSSARSSVITPRVVKRKEVKESTYPILKNLPKPKPVKTKPLTSVTVNSPILNKKVIKNESKSEKNKPKERPSVELERQRTKTRTLGENEAKVLTPEAIDNNAEMEKLTRKLSAKPKAFYVDLNDEKPKVQTKEEKVSEDDDVSYEDDFESYESDFESYHSDKSNNTDANSEDNNSDEKEDSKSTGDGNDDKEKDTTDNSLKDTKDEERMLDSGNFDLRDPQRSAQKTKPMDFIIEHSEDAGDKRISLTDEGFQDMSSSSTASSMKTMHVDILERPLLIDFSKSRKCKLKKQNSDRMKQRAKDLLGMITLHTMSYTLFELSPIPYDVYMSTYGRSNYKQTESQTYDDGVTEEIQTDEIDLEEKWTQHPIKFTKHEVSLQSNITNNNKRYGSNEDFLSKFTFLTSTDTVVEDKTDNDVTNDYKTNPLRIYLEQKDGVGSSKMFPYSEYKSKLENKEINIKRLKKFMKRAEQKVTNILSTTNESVVSNEYEKISPFPFSDDMVTLSPKDLPDVLKPYQFVNVVFSDSKSNLAMTVHRKSVLREKCLICLWDVMVNMKTPLKTLICIDDVSLARYRGGTEGIFVAALKDGSLHLWDLSEKATYPDDSDSDLYELEDVTDKESMSQVESDREWNLKNSNVGYHKNPVSKDILHSSAYTTSAFSLNNKEVSETITGLEIMDETKVQLENGKKVIGQICSLLRIGILTIMSIVREKRDNQQDKGKAFWSHTKLEKNVQINLTDYVDRSLSCDAVNKTFNLNAAKRRLSRRKSERSLLNDFSRPKSGASADSFDIDNDRPVSAASQRSRNLPQIESRGWDSGLVCKDLKVMKLNGADNYLIAKNCGEVLCLTRSMGVAKLNRLCITTDMTPVTKLEVSPHGLAYFLAATESGSVNLCSLVESRVLLTLDCRNGPPSPTTSMPEQEKYHTDNKGRFIGTLPQRSTNANVMQTIEFQSPLKSLHWLPTNPCSIVTLSLDGAVSVWQLERSDICPTFTKQTDVLACAQSQSSFATVTQNGDVEFHRLSDNQNLSSNLSLFQKYVTLL